MKYWEYNDEDLIKKKMYPLLPLQLFNLRKELDIALKKNNLDRIYEIEVIAKNLAKRIANEAKELFDEDEILGEDFHKILLGIQNLIEYLNRNYFRDDKIEEEMIDMTTTLYNPEVEKRGIEKGKKEEKLQIAINLLDVLPDEIISNKTGLSLEEVKKLRSENSI